MKLKLLAVIAITALLSVSCGKENDKQVENTKTEQTDNSTITVASGALNGDFIGGFTPNAYDAWVKNLIHDYSTYVSDRYGEYILNEVVNKNEPEIYTDNEGNKVYKFTLNDNLVWNNGDKITAKDYMFSALLNYSKEFKEAGATNIGIPKEIPGVEEYNLGKTRSIKGYKYIDDYTFEVTVKKEAVPYFYETSLVSVGPFPMNAIAPNLDIAEDGSSLKVKDGYEVTDDDKKSYEALINDKINSLKSEKEEIEKDENKSEDEKKNSVKTIDNDIKLLEQDLNEFKDGKSDIFDVLMQQAALYTAEKYRKNPTVTCGAYNFVKFENQTAILSKNDKYVGNFERKVPVIQNILVKNVNPKLNVDLTISGDVDIAPGIIEGEKIEKAKAADTTDMVSYKRAGYGKITFLTDLGATKHKEVRKAIAYLLDRDMFVQNVLGGYGTIVDGAYGLSQWMYKEKGKDFDEKAIHYTLNVEKANEELDKSPFIYEKDGKTKWDVNKAKSEYEKDKDNFKYYRYNKDKEILQVNHCGTTGVVVSDTIQSQLPDNGKKAGMLYNFEAVDFATLMTYMEKPNLNNPKFTAFNLATTFYPKYEPYYTYHSSQVGIGNTSRVNDKQIDEIVEEMKKLSPDQKDVFADKWLELQLWFNDYLPEVPLYSNEYFDIYNKKITGIETSPFFDWSRAIVDIKPNK